MLNKEDHLPLARTLTLLRLWGNPLVPEEEFEWQLRRITFVSRLSCQTAGSSIFESLDGASVPNLIYEESCYYRCRTGRLNRSP